MSEIELFLIIAVWGLFAGCISMFVFAVIEEFQWKQRVQIGYVNFKRLEKFYSFRTKKIILAFYGIDICFAIGIVVGLNLFARNYAEHLQILNFIVFFSVMLSSFALLLSATKERKNHDLTPMESIYNRVINSFENQESLKLLLQKLEALRNRCIDENNRIINVIENLTGQKGAFNLDEALVLLDSSIKECKGQLNGFDNSLTEKFDLVLHTFLTTGKLEQNQIGLFTFNEFKDLETLRQKFVERQKELVLIYILQIIDKRSFAQADSIVGLYELIDELKISYSPALIDKTFSYIDSYENLRTVITEKILISNSFNAELYVDFIIDKHYFWLLNYEYKLSQDMQTKIAIEIVACDADQYVFAFLMQLNIGIISILKAAIASIKTDNKAKELFTSYIQVVAEKEDISANKAKANEDYYITLLNYARRNNGKNLTSKLNTIKANKFIGAKDLYMAKIKEENELYGISLRVLFAFLNSKKASSFFNRSAIISLFHEYRYTLSISELKIFSILLMTMILICEDDKTLIEFINKLLKNKCLTLNAELKSVVCSSHIKEIKATLIIKILYDYDRCSLLNIVNRTEKERLLYSKLIGYGGGNAL